MRPVRQRMSFMFLAFAIMPALQAGEFNSVLSIGDAAPAWKELPGVDGKKHSLADLKGTPFVVVCFTCNSCPIAADYEDRIIAFATKFTASGKVAVVAINVNTIEEDRLPKMKERAKAKGFPFAYLFDESQKIAKDYGAVFTPEFFILDADRKIAYMGGFDDNSVAEKAKQHHLDAALTSLLAGSKPPKAETTAAGCRIRFERPKRQKPKK